MTSQTKILNIFNPCLIFSLIWLLQVVGYFFFRDSFGEYSSITWMVVTLGVFSFLAGGWLTTRSGQYREIALTSNENHFPILIFMKAAYIVYGACAVFAVWKIFSFLALDPDSMQSVKSIRDTINFDFANRRIIFNYFRIFHFGVALSLFSLTFVSRLKKWQFAGVFLVGALSALATTGRLFLLLYVVACSVILLKRRVIAARGLIVLFSTFFVFFFLIAVLVKKGVGEQTVSELLVWNIQVYFFSPLAAFNSFVTNNFPYFEGGVLIPNAFKAVLNKVGFSLKMRPPLMPFIEVPVRTNVFTGFFPLYHDGKMWGVIIGSLFLGYMHNSIYWWFRASDSSVVLYVFAVSLYPLTLTFFEDAYFSSPGFWFVILSPVMFFLLAHAIMVRKRQEVLNHD